MTFIKNITHETNKTLTTNEDVTYKSTYNANIDFFGQVASKRGSDQLHLVTNLFEKAYKENSFIALMNLFYLRDITNGYGERQSTKACLRWLADNDPDAFKKINIDLYLEIGRWDDLIQFATHPKVGDFILDIIYMQLVRDCNGIKINNPISLLAKWLPTESSKKAETKSLARFIAKKLFKGNYKLYRRTISELRQYIGIIETKLTNKDYNFDYNKLPAKASMKYISAFIRNDYDKFISYKESIQKDPSKIADKVNKLQIHEITALEVANYNWGSKLIFANNDTVEYANALWDALPKDTLKKKCIVVRDGSGSMGLQLPKSHNTLLDVATSLAIYMSERLTGEFKDNFITFSQTPKLVNLSDCSTLSDKLKRVYQEDDLSNTNIEQVYSLIYHAALKSAPEDVPDYILIISDMEFDKATSYKCGCVYDELKSTLDTFEEKFSEAGLKLPQMIFWNVNAKRSIFPTNEKMGSIFISGFSKALFEKICNMDTIADDAETFMLNILQSNKKIVSLAQQIIK